MQDRFVGDIGDFANHGILRALCGKPEKPVHGLKLGVVEYFNKPSGKDLEKGAGNHIEFLKVLEYNKSKYQVCDPKLYDALRKLVGDSLVSGTELKIDSERARTLLPVDERYYDVRIPVGDRHNWLKGALQKTADANVIFVNPDNGIRVKIKDKEGKRKERIVELEEKTNSCQHISFGELKCLYGKGKSLIIYHQLGQGNKKEETAEDRIKSISKCLLHGLKQPQPVSGLWVFRWRAESPRAYFIVARTEEHKKIEEQLRKFREGPWKNQKNFTEVKNLTCPPSS